ncbi:histidine kinase dimerization/phospho-acceptor domain-containing protein [Aureimonas sp. AU12]|uniref:histidine kinase dimerization/phospho-acceptor domain-containing protein n=1 Tax=Aureimonas sp. AU12 TaxID=1638161 RepID=UPI0007822B4B|nr:histidine kinase dimerization/phospho-acceptor domain-containing protein [Aureimonas sp. AU12]
MAIEAIRTANALGSAIAVLSSDLASVVWANGAGHALLAGPDMFDGTVMRQIGTAAETLAAKGRTQLLLRPATAGMGRAVLARLERLAGFETPLALLTVRLDTAPSETRLQLAERLLAESGLGDALACIVARDGFVAGTASLPAEERPLLAAQGQEFLGSGEERLRVEDEFGALAFATVADGLVLVHLDLGVQGEGQVLAGEMTSDEDAASTPALPIADEDAHLPAAALSGAPDEPEPMAIEPPAETASALTAFAADLTAEPSRFVWQIDAEGCFSSFSPEFALAVGPSSAAVIGRSFSDVATVYGFDERGDIGRLLARRDTWSGRSILWPIEGTDRRAPVDLAALPIYSRDRAFEGFRGFGVVRPAEAVEDPDALGLVLAAPVAPAADAGSTAPTNASPAEDEAAPPEATEAGGIKLHRIAAEAPGSFGRRPEPPSAPAIIQLDDRRRPREGALSSAEEAAFRAIGAELGVAKAAAAAAAGLPAPAQQPAIAPPAAPLPAEALEATTHAQDASEDHEDSQAFVAAHELEDMLDALPLAVLVQMQERLVFANRRFFALTGYVDLDALEDAGGIDHLVASCGVDESDSEAVLVRADGQRQRARLHLQRVAFAGRSCLMMSFPTVETAGEAQLGREVADLENERDELQAVLDTATDGILLLDGAERLRKMNGAAEALFGLKPEQYLGVPFADLLAPDSRKTALDYIEMLRDDGLASILNDGREVSARVSEGSATIPLFVTLGRLADGRGWCVVIRDIAQWKHAETDLVTARQQAEDASLHKSRFLANISHELRTPLNAIIGFADVMASECFGPIGHERYLEYLGDIKRSGHHVLDLVNDLLDISKIEAGKVELAFESVSLNDVVAEVVSLMQPQANRERVIVRSVLPASVPPVVADRRSVRQIALNLIANAVRFTPAGGQIIASTHYGNEGEVTLRFRDSGIGMTDREIEIALTPFQQVNAGTRGRGEGTGLGLPLTKAMAEANRALFSIASTPGEGTLVEITFPAQRVLAD